MADETPNQQYLNKHCVAADEALGAYGKSLGFSTEDLENIKPITQVANLIADIGHLCDDMEAPFKLVVDHGLAKWRAERKVFHG